MQLNKIIKRQLIILFVIIVSVIYLLGRISESKEDTPSINSGLLDIKFEDKSVVIAIPLDYAVSAQKRESQRNDYIVKSLKMNFEGFGIIDVTKEYPGTASDLISCTNRIYGTYLECKHSYEDNGKEYCILEQKKSSRPSSPLASLDTSLSVPKTSNPNNPLLYVVHDKRNPEICLGITAIKGTKENKDFMQKFISEFNVYENDQTEIDYQLTMDNLSEILAKGEIKKIDDGSIFIGSANVDDPNVQYNAEIYRRAMCLAHGDYTINAVNCLCENDIICWIKNTPKMIMGFFGTVISDLFTYRWM